MSSKHRARDTAQEQMAALTADAEHQALVEAEDREREERSTRLRQLEWPLLVDLREVGIDVDSAWDLVNTSTPYPAALPILVRHLEDPSYPELLREGMARLWQ